MGIDRDFDKNREPVVWATDDAPFTGPEVKVLLDENETLRARVAELEGADTAYASALKHGLMTDNMHELAKALGLREGKHTAESVARIALDRITELEGATYDARMSLLLLPPGSCLPTKPTSGSWVEDAKALINMGAQSIDGATVKWAIEELETANNSLGATLQSARHDIRDLEEELVGVQSDSLAFSGGIWNDDRTVWISSKMAPENAPKHSHRKLSDAHQAGITVGRAEGWADAVEACRLICLGMAEEYAIAEKYRHGIGAEACADKIEAFEASFRKT